MKKRTWARGTETAYYYNADGQRVLRVDNRRRRWEYGYDDLGQLTAAEQHFYEDMQVTAASPAPDQTPQGNPVPGMKFAYAYDDIGNRTQTGRNDDPARDADYTANDLNQYVAREVPGKIDVYGLAAVGGVTQVNGVEVPKSNPGADHEMEKRYFHTTLDTANTAGPTVETVTVQTHGPIIPENGEPEIETDTGRILTPARNETFTYDHDGNLLQDGRFQYTWNAENRLVTVETTAAWPQDVRVKLEFTYDYLGRRTQKKVYDWNTDHWSLTTDYRFVYDGWNLFSQETIPAADPQNPTHLNFVWGIDLSGTLQGAGGVGGLVAYGAGNRFESCEYDGNGNIMSQGVAGKNQSYEYDPFGKLLRQRAGEQEDQGDLGRNPFRFSTKYFDEETELYYYGYRYYNPDTGRWLSRDPLEEDGGENLYAFVLNDPISLIDPDGLKSVGQTIQDFVRSNPKWEGTMSLPPIPVGPGSVMVTISGSVQSENCCKNGMLMKYPKGEFTLRLGYRVGSGSRRYPGPRTAPATKIGKRKSRRPSRNKRIGGNARNDHMQDPNNPDQDIKRKHAEDQKVKKNGGGLISAGKECKTCPEGNSIDVRGEVGIEGEFGFKKVAYGKVTQPLTAEFDLIHGWDVQFEGGIRDIGWRASAYIEGYGQGTVEAHLAGILLIPTGQPCF